MDTAAGRISYPRKARLLHSYLLTILFASNKNLKL